MRPRSAAPGRTFESYNSFYANSEYAKFSPELRAGGRQGLEMLTASQEKVNLIDAAVPMYNFQIGLIGPGEVVTDVGFGLVYTNYISPDQILYVPPDTEAAFRVPQPHRLFSLAVPSSSWDEVSSSYGLEPRLLEATAGRFTDNLAATTALRRLWTECRAEGLNTNDLLIDGWLLQFMAAVYGLASMSPAGKAAAQVRRMDRVVQYIEANLGSPFSLSDLAQIACLSPSQLSRTFRGTTGKSVWHFVLERRLERARTALTSTDTPIAQIAFACGFSSQAHMTSSFRRHFATTPGVIRRS